MDGSSHILDRCVAEDGDLASVGIISREHREDPVVQIFRELRTRIIQQSEGRNCSVLVTGVTPGAGGSFVARNLGAAFAFDAGKTALLIDCNLKDPGVHRLIPAFGDGPGLMDYLDEPDFDVAKIIYPVGIPRYRVIPTGAPRPVPAEYFTSPKMRYLMDTARDRYVERFVVVDGPHMTDLADVRILAELSDYVLIVARYGRVTGSQLDRCVDAVSERKLLGVVFNDEPRIPGMA